MCGVSYANGETLRVLNLRQSRAKPVNIQESVTTIPNGSTITIDTYWEAVRLYYDTNLWYNTPIRKVVL